MSIQPPPVVERPSPARAAAPVRKALPKIVWPLVALAAVVVFNLIFTSNFLPTVMDGRLFGGSIDIPNRAAPVMLVALGMTLVLATGGVDLSVGAIMAICGAAAALLVQKGYPLPLVIAIPLLIALAAGLWNGLLVAYLDLQPIIATLILMVAGRGIAQLLSGGQILTISDPSFKYLGNGFFLMLPFSLTIVAATWLLTWLGTRRTAVGLFIESVGNNATASYFAGVNSRLVKLAVYTFCGFCSGIAGLIVASNITAADSNNAGLYLELDAILAVVIGGTSLNGGRFSLVGSIIGALIIQSVTTTIFTRDVPPQATRVVKAIVVLAVCLLQSEALRESIARKLRRNHP